MTLEKYNSQIYEIVVQVIAFYVIATKPNVITVDSVSLRLFMGDNSILNNEKSD